MAFGKKKNEGEEQEAKKPKKKIKKVDIAQNLAYSLLGIVMGLVVAIVACALNPDLTSMLSEVLKSGKEAENANKTDTIARSSNIASTVYSFSFEDTEAENVANTENAAVPEGDEELTSSEGTVSKDAESETPQEGAAEDTSASEETSSDASGSEGSLSDVSASEGTSSDEGSSENASEEAPSEDDPAEAVEETETKLIPLVTIKTSGAEDESVTEIAEEEPEYTPPVVSGKSAYAELKPDVVEVENEKQAKQISNAVGYGETGEGLDFNGDYYPYYSFLDDNEKALYRQVYANATVYNTSFKPIVSAGMSEIKNVIESVSYDHPELFWLDTTFYTEFDYNGEAIKIVLSFYDRLGDLNAARSQFEASANEILSGAEGLASDYEKELYIHNALADRLIYKHSPIDQSAYSGIVSGYTVCAGYAKAFQYLCQRLGIPAYLCVGMGANELHAWNIVRADGEYYNVDCTWDDQDPTTYDYFNLSDRMNYMHTRMFQSVNLPACTAEPTLVIAY